MKFEKETFLEALPLVLAEDADMLSLAEVIAGLYADDFAKLRRLLIYPAIDTLDEGVIDALAYDFKADWWDDNATISEKRETLKAIWATHRLAGTKEGVEKSIGALYPGATVSEWFEYEGEPYHFKLDVPIGAEETGGEGNGYKSRVLWLLSYFKNLRSVIDEISFTRTLSLLATLVVSAAAERGLSITQLPEILPAFDPETILWIAAVLERWNETGGIRNLTSKGLVSWPNRDTKTIEIYPGLAVQGAHTLSSYLDGDTICIVNEGLTASENTDTHTLIITGG